MVDDNIRKLFENGLDRLPGLSVVPSMVLVMEDTATHASGTAAGVGSDDGWVGPGGLPPLLPSLLLEMVSETVSSLDGTLWAATPPAELLATMRSLERLRSILDAVQLQVVHEVDATSAARHEGWASTRDYLTAVTGGTKGTGRRLVTLARALASDRTTTATALGAGRLSRSQAEVIVSVVDQLPVDARLRAAAEQLLVEDARDHDASELARRGRYVVERLDPDGAERRDERALEREERAAHLSRFLAISEDGIGGVRLKGRGTVEDAAWLKAVLFPLAAPRPAGEPGACGAQPTTAATGGDRRGVCGYPDCAHDGGDPRDHGARLWDALVDAARLLADIEVPPESHGARPRLSVSLEYESLVDALVDAEVSPHGSSADATRGLLRKARGPRRAAVDDGGTLSAATARRLACDAELIPVVLGAGSQVLDVGRSSRLVTHGLWLALVARDRHCAFPGCQRQPVACDAHHLQHWADGGVTSLDNLVLLCRSHHTMLHTTPWRARLSPHDRRPEFLPPPRGRPGDAGDQSWIRRRTLRE
jgi:hypothetical protein